MSEYKILLEECCSEIIVKKSRFIAYICQASSEEEAASYIDMIKKKHWDAKHNCTAFIIGDNNELTRCSDDGEPSGTAGKPMLEYLMHNNLHNIVAVVTRYFGGVLLGTGGLVRAYKQALDEAVSKAKISYKISGFKYSIATDYNGAGKIQYILNKAEIKGIGIEYKENVVIDVVIPEDIRDKVIYDITETTNGQAMISLIGQKNYAIWNNEIIYL